MARRQPDPASALPTPPPTQPPDPIAIQPNDASSPDPPPRPPCPPLAWSEDLPFLRTASLDIRTKRDAILEHIRRLADRESDLAARHKALQDREELIAARLRDASFRLKEVSAELQRVSTIQGDASAEIVQLKERHEFLDKAIHDLYSQQAAVSRDKVAFNKMRDETYEVWEFTSCPELEAERSERERLWAERRASAAPRKVGDGEVGGIEKSSD